MSRATQYAMAVIADTYLSALIDPNNRIQRQGQLIRVRDALCELTGIETQTLQESCEETALKIKMMSVPDDSRGTLIWAAAKAFVKEEFDGSPEGYLLDTPIVED